MHAFVNFVNFESLQLLATFDVENIVELLKKYIALQNIDQTHPIESRLLIGLAMLRLVHR